MSESITCPVCGKVGIPDYHKDEVVCPCCSTDLSIYKMLADSQSAHTTKETKDRKWKIATAASATIAIALLVFLASKQTVTVNDDTELKEKVVMLNDSIQKIQNNLNLAYQEIEDLKKTTSNKSDNFYVVRKGDSPCLISRKLYGTERRYKEIEAIVNKPLQPGDTLYLK